MGPAEGDKKKVVKKLQSQLSDAVKAGDLATLRTLLVKKPQLNDKINQTGGTFLHLAAISGHAEVCTALISAGAEVNKVDNGSYTPLHAAAMAGKPETLEVLIKAKADVSAQTGKSESALELALENLCHILATEASDAPKSKEAAAALEHRRMADLRCAILLVNAGAPLDFTLSRGMSALHVAAAAGSVELCAKLVEKTPDDLTAEDKDETQPLHHACKRGHLAVVKNLLEAGAPADGAGSDGPSPMALALLEDDQWDWGDMEAPDGSALTKGEKAAAYADLMRSRCDCAVVLVESGAPVDWTAETISQGVPTEDTPLHFAAMYGHVPLIEALLKRGLGVELRNVDKRTPLAAAAILGQPAACAALLNAGAAVDARDSRERTALHSACEDGSGGIVPLLLEAKADINLEDEDGFDAFHIACAAEDAQSEDAIALLRAGATFDWVDEARYPRQPGSPGARHRIADLALEEKAETPLHVAAMWNDEEIVRLMLAKGANPDAKDHTGETPLHRFAIASNLHQVLHELVAQDRRRATVRDDEGRTPLGVACGPCRRAIERALYSLGRYELINPGTPKHRSATCVVLFAIDHGEEEEEEAVPTPPPAAVVATELVATAKPVATAAEAAPLRHPGGQPSLSRATLAPNATPPPPAPPRLRDVALKVMLHKDQFDREVSVRGGLVSGSATKLDPRYVLPVIRTHELSAEDAAGLGGDFWHCLVMERAQEDLAGAIAHSRMAFDTAREVAAALGRCVSHLHDAGLLHTDIKPLNVVRTAQGEWKLIDLDAAARLRPEPGIAGSKTSSAYSPPEMFYRVPADAPEGAGVPGSWALRNWGALKPGDKWPFEAVKATPALDMWAFGIVVYELIMRQKAFLDDVDCNLATAADAAALAEWTAATKRELLDRVPDGWAKALLQRLLAKDPLDRPPSMALVLCHPLLANAFRREAPPLTSPGEKHHFFISHFQKNAGPTCMALKMAVCSAVPGAQVWFDQDVSNKTEQGMMAGVAGSRFFLMFLSREVFARPFVQKEVAQALKLNKPIIIVRATDDRYGAARTVADLVEGAADTKEAQRLADAILAPGRALADIPWYSEREYREVGLTKLLEAMGMHTQTGEEGNEGAGRRPPVPIPKGKKGKVAASAETADEAHETFRRTLKQLAMGCRAPPLPSELKYHACIIHDEAVSGADCRMLKGAVEESFAGAAVLLPEPTAEALLAAVRVSKCLLIFLTRGLLATPGSPRLAAVAEGVALGRGFVLVHEMDPGRGGTASFYDYIVETPDARAREIFNDATSIPWHRDPSFMGVCALKVLLEGLIDGPASASEKVAANASPPVAAAPTPAPVADSAALPTHVAGAPAPAPSGTSAQKEVAEAALVEAPSAALVARLQAEVARLTALVGAAVIDEALDAVVTAVGATTDAPAGAEESRSAPPAHQAAVGTGLAAAKALQQRVVPQTPEKKPISSSPAAAGGKPEPKPPPGAAPATRSPAARAG